MPTHETDREIEMAIRPADAQLEATDTDSKSENDLNDSATRNLSIAASDGRQRSKLRVVAILVALFVR